jgi:hypothetical protein
MKFFACYHVLLYYIQHRVSLPEVSFFSLRELLDGLLAMLGSDKSMKKICTFRQHIHSRSSFVDLSVDISEAENEISGVILGSLVCYSPTLNQ